MRRMFQLLLFVCTFCLISCAEEEAVVEESYEEYTEEAPVEAVADAE